GRSQDNYSTIGSSPPLVVNFEAGGWQRNCAGYLIVGWIKGGQRLNFLEHKRRSVQYERVPRNSSWQGARSTPVVGIGLENRTGDSTNYVCEIPQRDDRWRHHVSPPPQFRHGTEGEGNILQSPALVIQPAKLSNPLI
ncbi:hypothetical protein TNCV_4494401, partial [Trichonephila clavipes]